MDKNVVKTKSSLSSIAAILQLVDKYVGIVSKFVKRFTNWRKDRKNAKAKKRQQNAYDKAKKAVKDEDVKKINDILQS